MSLVRLVVESLVLRLMLVELEDVDVDSSCFMVKFPTNQSMLRQDAEEDEAMREAHVDMAAAASASVTGAVPGLEVAAEMDGRPWCLMVHVDGWLMVHGE